MTTYFRDRCHTPLAREKAEKLVSELHALIDAYVDEGTRESSVFAEDPPHGLEGLSVLTSRELRDLDDDAGGIGGDSGGIGDDLAMYVAREPPPTSDQARDIAAATGYVAHSLVLDAVALERLASCRSTIVLEYPGRLEFHPFFVTLQRRLFEEIGLSVVESGYGSSFQPSEVRVAELAQRQGADDDAPSARARRGRAPRRPRAARPGEVEALAVHGRLLEAIEDPLSRATLQDEFAKADDGLRRYASLLIEDGAQGDAQAAKALGVRAKAVASHRAALAALLDRISGDEED